MQEPTLLSCGGDGADIAATLARELTKICMSMAGYAQVGAT